MSLRSSPKSLRVLLIALAPAIVVGRFAAHALFLPAFEGPDETFHLARVLDFAEHSLARALRGSALDPRIVAAASSMPCGPIVRASRGCPPFGTAPAAFNLLRRAQAPAAASEAPQPATERNPENNQPPLFYLVAGTLLRLFRFAVPGSLATPGRCLLFSRMISLAFVALGVWAMTRLRAYQGGLLPAMAILATLCLPGASDSLSRCSNDAALFAWCALAVGSLEASNGGRRTIILLALGPLVKLTAFPVVAFAAVALWRAGRRRVAIAGGLASLLVFPLQLVRGWRWGGTLELNRPFRALDESFGTIVAGFGRSVYTFLKTTFWLGGWSFFRAPLALVIAFGALVLAALVVLKRRKEPVDLPAHLAGLLVAAIGFTAFALANRRYFGTWGGVGGWYAWTWYPWLVTAMADTLVGSGKSSRWLLAATVVFMLVTNVAYYCAALRLYGI